MSDQGLYRVVYTAVAQALDAEADILVFAPATPVDVVEFGFICDVLTATAGPIELDFRPTAGSDTDRVDGTAALGRVCTVPDATAPGEHIYKRVGTGASATTTTPLEVDPGEEAVLDVSGEPTAGDGTFYIRYRERPQAGTRIATNSTEST